jgi:hypothetical protein
MANGPVINPDSEPARPFDVTVQPDAPPRAPFDVAVSPDGPPREPIDVPVNPDGEPRDPFDVSVSPDGPPARPFDVVISPDAGPLTPINVPVSPDRPARDPFDVVIAPDSPPGRPFDVPVAPDAPPPRPIDVRIVLDAPPRAAFDVPITPDPPVLVIKGSPGAAPTMDQIISAVATFDGNLGSFLSTIIEVDPVTSAGPGGGALDPRALSRWLADYRAAVGDAGIARFISEQTVLYAMNPVVSRIFDPTYFLKMLVPGSMGIARPTIDTEAGITLETVAQGRDALLQAAVHANPLRPGGNGLSDRPDLYGPENTYQDGQAYSVDSVVDSVLSDSIADASSPFLRSEAGIKRFDASAFFEDRGSDGSSAVRATSKARAASGIDNVFSSRLAGSAAIDGIIRVGLPGEQTNGSVLSTTQDPSEVIDDDDARVPVSFTDLRQVPGRKFRSVYFRPENLQLGTSFAPDFSESSTFGRVDPVVGYQRTTRTISVSFDVFAMAPEDLERMYNKMVWLQSMVYPTYGADSLMESGPVVRMRIGDIVATDLGGVPGVIKSLDFDFDNVLWELRRGMKVPMRYGVKIAFLVLHDGPVGSVNGVFGVFQLPPGGNAPDRDTNLAGGPRDSRSDQSQGVTALPGRFFKFGEPRD